jgi:ribosomal protein S18 acetylase RimI-like enzyme
VGCYIIEGSYISDIAVHPCFQGKGYGSLMLKHCIRLMREIKSVSDIYLRVAKSNSGAKRLYERNGFQVISHFAEHTYQRN